MKKLLLVMLLAATLAGCRTKQEAVTLPPASHDAPGMEYSPTTLIIMVDAEVGKEPLRRAIAQSGASIIYDYNTISGMAIRKPDNMTLEQAIELFKKVEGVLSVERDHIMHLH